MSPLYCWSCNWQNSSSRRNEHAFTILEWIVESSNLSLCWPKWFTNYSPASEIPTPGSINTSTFLVTVKVEILTIIIKADSALLSLMLYKWTWLCVSPSCGRTQNLMVLVEPWCNRTAIVILCESSCLPANFYEEPQLIAIQACLIMHWELPTVSSVCPCLVSWIHAWHKFVYVWCCFHRFVTISVPWTMMLVWLFLQLHSFTIW